MSEEYTEIISTTLDPGHTAFKNGVSITNYGNVPAVVIIKTPKQKELPPVEFDYDEPAEDTE